MNVLLVKALANGLKAWWRCQTLDGWLLQWSARVSRFWRTICESSVLYPLPMKKKSREFRPVPMLKKSREFRPVPMLKKSREFRPVPMPKNSREFRPVPMVFSMLQPELR